jgi:hypothetical protein
MVRKLRYSERRRVAETGALEPLEHDDVPEGLRRALEFVTARAAETANVGDKFARSLDRACVEYFGTTGVFRSDWILEAALDDFLDFVEILVEESVRKHEYDVPVGMGVEGMIYRTCSRAAFPNVEEKFNELADRHRLGYRAERGEVRRVGSPVLSDVVVGPALLAAQRPGWEHVERSFREALHHQRGPSDENDDALTAAACALEAALKAAGVPGTTLGDLAANFRKMSLGARQLGEVPETLQKLLSRTAALRNIHGDAHGKAPGHADDVPQELVDFAIHLVGSFIVYVEAAQNAQSGG